VAIRRRLRAPESVRERRGADYAALARSGITSCSACLANPVVALIVAKHIATRPRGKLCPAALEREYGGRHVRRGRVTTRRLCHSRGKQ